MVHVTILWRYGINKTNNTMKKQTAVEWLFEQMLDDKLDNRYELLQQAIAMEREQIIDAYNNGDLRSADLYYNETYKGGEQ